MNSSYGLLSISSMMVVDSSRVIKSNSSRAPLGLLLTHSPVLFFVPPIQYAVVIDAHFQILAHLLHLSLPISRQLTSFPLW